MIRRTHQTLTNLLAVVLLCAPLSHAAFARQTDGRKSSTTQPPPQSSTTTPAPKFTGSIFGDPETSKSRAVAARTAEPSSSTESGEPSSSSTESAEPSPSPVPYAFVALKTTTPAVKTTTTRALARQSSTSTTVPPPPASATQTTQQPAPSANNPPSPQTPAQTPQTASPTQTQTQQSTNPAAPAQSVQPAQPTVPPTAPANPAPSTQQVPAVQTPQGQQQQTPAQIQQPPAPVAPGRESVPAAAPQGSQLNVPEIAPGFKAESGPFPTLERVGVDMAEQRPLSVREAIELALANNKDIEVARENVRAAEFDLKAARGAYDPHFLTNSYYERTETPAASFLSGTTMGAVTQSGFFSTSSVQGLTPKFGGGYRLDFVNNRITTDNIFAALNPQYPSSLTLSYTQPILKGRDFDQSRRQIEIAKKNLSLTDAQFRQRAIETITNVQRAYWDLVYALRNLQIQQEAVRDARAQLEHNRRLVSEGMLAPIDVVAAEAQVSGFEQSVYSALDDVGRAENNLKNLVAENREAPLWNVSVVPTDSVDLAPPVVDLTGAMQVALKNRPELQQSDVAAAINEVEQRYARDQTKPQVDLIASCGTVGLSGTLNTSSSNPLTASSTQFRESINQLIGVVNPGLPPGQQLVPIPLPPPQTLPGVLIGGEGQSLTNLAANRFKDFRVGVTINLPFRNTTAEAQLGRTLVDRDRIRTQREQLEQLIQVDVRNAIQQVRTAESRLRAAAAARSASEQQYTSEQRKLDAAQSTVFLVLERQTALTTARGNELRAQTELNKAIADLQRATGNALEQNRVEIRLK
ncbi:MAG TPA: TolC family protein [Pyrinomonadaceae bacterium]|jgi:HAE1 family hydrophobic/amphiphilic exporter-1|nr:TolC family protein [Pyrinomonadaceae bacterium]